MSTILPAAIAPSLLLPSIGDLSAQALLAQTPAFAAELSAAPGAALLNLGIAAWTPGLAAPSACNVVDLADRSRHVDPLQRLPVRRAAGMSDAGLLDVHGTCIGPQATLHPAAAPLSVRLMADERRTPTQPGPHPGQPATGSIHTSPHPAAAPAVDRHDLREDIADAYLAHAGTQLDDAWLRLEQAERGVFPKDFTYQLQRLAQIERLLPIHGNDESTREYLRQKLVDGLRTQMQIARAIWHTWAVPMREALNRVVIADALHAPFRDAWQAQNNLWAILGYGIDAAERHIVGAKKNFETAWPNDALPSKQAAFRAGIQTLIAARRQDKSDAWWIKLLRGWTPSAATRHAAWAARQALINVVERQNRDAVHWFEWVAHTQLLTALQRVAHPPTVLGDDAALSEALTHALDLLNHATTQWHQQAPLWRHVATSRHEAVNTIRHLHAAQAQSAIEHEPLHQLMPLADRIGRAQAIEHDQQALGMRREAMAQLEMAQHALRQVHLNAKRSHAQDDPYARDVAAHRLAQLHDQEHALASTPLPSDPVQLWHAQVMLSSVRAQIATIAQWVDLWPAHRP